MLKAYKYRLYPNKEQEVLLNKHFGCVRFVYNYSLNLKISAYQNENIRLSKFDLDKQLTELKKLDEYNWLKEVNSQSLQASNRHLDVAFSNFFKQHNDFPKFKSKKTNRFSFEIPANIYLDIDNNKVSFPKFKEGVNLVISRKPKGVIRQATVSKTPTNKYFISILYETGVDNKQKEIITRENSVGIDLGIKDFVITSDGVKYENNKYLRKLEDKLAKEQIKLSRKVKGSNNRNKQRIKVARVYEKISNQRLDYLHKISSILVSENKTICIEDLNVQGMIKNHKLAKSISDVSWGKFVELLRYKSEWYGVNILQIGRFEPSSKMCSCGVINKELTLKDREWTCETCGLVHDRDILASNNIKKFALNAIGLGQPELTPIESKSLDPRGNRNPIGL
jgi:putative transposase